MGQKIDCILKNLGYKEVTSARGRPALIWEWIWFFKIKTIYKWRGAGVVEQAALEKR